MFPLFVNLRGRLCLVVGGGAVGLRKAGALREAGARIRLVSLGPRPHDIPTDVDWLAEPYRPAHLDGVTLAVAAATAEVNRQVVAEARTRGIWVNSATDPDRGDAFFPATLQRGDLVLAVGTGGQAPALARQIRDRLTEWFDEAFALWVALLGEVRPLVLERVPAAKRRALLERLCEWTWLERLRGEGVEPVRAAMRAEVEALAEGRSPPL
jgi:siroheme synthase-like protein